jgi:hypothetical protein
LDYRKSEALSADTIACSKSNFSVDNKLEIKSKVMVISRHAPKPKLVLKFWF